MNRLGGLLGSNNKQTKTKSNEGLITETEETIWLQEALEGVTFLMNDDLENASKILAAGDSSYHKLGRALICFIQAVLGFESEVMKEAGQLLYEAASSASTSQRQVLQSTESFRSSIYPVGTEFALCKAEAQIMNALVAVLNENLTESLKGFYNMRKSYQVLESIYKAEKNFLMQKPMMPEITAQTARRASQKSGAKERRSLDDSSLKRSGGFDSTRRMAILQSAAESNMRDDASDSDSQGFFDAEEDPTVPDGMGARAFESSRSLDIPHATTTTSSKSSSFEVVEDSDQAHPNHGAPSTEALKPHTLIDPQLLHHPIDEFVNSGYSLHYGILLLILSLVPPAYIKILSILGFTGDRARGLSLLWHATRYDNVNGSVAGLTIMLYLNSHTSFCDILPPTLHQEFPRERCLALLQRMRKTYPNSRLWLLEEARTLVSSKRAQQGVDLLYNHWPATEGMKQIEALRWFECCLDNLALHRYQDCADAVLKCVKLNNWSHGLYFYTAASCHLELYRMHKTGNAALLAAVMYKPLALHRTSEEAAEHHAREAERLYAEAPAHLGKKRFLARQLPFDVLAERKLRKWAARAKASGCRLVDVIGASPVQELTLFWSGFRRMDAPGLRLSLDMLDMNEKFVVSEIGNIGEKQEPLYARDEIAISALLRAVVLRCMGRNAEAQILLQREIIQYRDIEFKGGDKDNWVPPVARYEMGVNLWMEAAGLDSPSVQAVKNGAAEEKPSEDAWFVYNVELAKKNSHKLEEAMGWLKKSRDWDGYDLDNRLGIKVSTGIESLKALGVKA